MDNEVGNIIEYDGKNGPKTVAQLIPTKSDKELAKEHRQLIMEAAQPLMNALTNANRDGFKTQLAFGENAFGEVIVQHFVLLRQF